MPTILRLDLDFGVPHIADPRHLHAVVSSWLDGSHEDGSQHRDTDKQWAVGPQQPTDAGLRLDVRLLDDRLVDRVCELARAGERVEFGDRAFHLEGRIAAPPAIVFAVEWDELDEPLCMDVWRFGLQSPLVFNSGRSGYHVNLDATSMLRTLAHRWQTWHPRHTRVHVAADGFAVSARVKAVAQPYDLPTMPRRALVGRLELRALERSHAMSLSKLAQWAQFAGLGAKTTHGFGATSVRPCPS